MWFHGQQIRYFSSHLHTALINKRFMCSISLH